MILIILLLLLLPLSAEQLPQGLDLAIAKPLAVDLNSDGIKEFLLPTVGGKIWLFDQNMAGLQKENWPVTLPDQFGETPAVITDSTGKTNIGVLGMKGNFFVLDSEGKLNKSTDTGQLNGSVLSTGDFNNDGESDFAFGVPEGTAYFFSSSGDAQSALRIPSRISTDIIAYDWDRDGKNEAVIKGDDDAVIYFYKNNLNYPGLSPSGLPDGVSPGKMIVSDPDDSMTPAIVYDVVDKSGKLNIVKVRQDKSFEIPLKIGYKPKTNLVYDDFDGDGQLDLVTVDPDNRLHLYLGLQKEAEGFPRTMEELKDISGKLEKADLDNDGRPEIIFLTNLVSDERMTGFLHAFSPGKGIKFSGYPVEVGYNNGQILKTDVEGDFNTDLILTCMEGETVMQMMPNLKKIRTTARIPFKALILARDLTFY